MNCVSLMGNVGMNPEVKTFGNGKKLALLSISTDERKKDGQGKYQRSSNWHKLVIRGKQAELVENYVGKGQRLFVEGKLVQKNWSDKQGKKRRTTEIEVTRLFFINKKNRQEAITDELPF